MSRRINGYSLTELLVALAIIGLFVSLSAPSLVAINRRSALRGAAGELRSILHLARMRAITRNTHCGVKFILAGDKWQFALYDDGDGDGIRTDDINRGVDRCVIPPRPALRETDAVTIGLLDDAIRDPDGEPLDESPVRFGRSAICSFTPYGESTPGTVYLTDGESELYALRVYGATAKIRTLRHDLQAKRWSDR